MSPELLQIIVDIIRTEMDLASDQVVIYNQQWVVPNDNRLYVSINLMGTKPYANNRSYSQTVGTDALTGNTNALILQEEQSINTADILSIHVYSYGSQARVRRNEIMFAMNSTYAEQQMEANSFSIGPVPTSFVDVSEPAGTEILNRYAITFNVIYGQSITSPVAYYDQFPIGKPAIQP